MKKRILSILCAGMISLPLMADVFDDNKQGFIVGLGLGLTGVSTEIDFHQGNVRDEGSIGLATSFKLGYAFNEQFLVYYTNQVDWYTFDDSSTRVGLTGVGVDYYFAKTSGLYTKAMLGLGSFGGVNNSSESTGYGFGLGLGYDLLPHMSVEVEYMHIGTEKNDIETDSNSLRVKFQYLWY